MLTCVKTKNVSGKALAQRRRKSVHTQKQRRSFEWYYRRDRDQARKVALGRIGSMPTDKQGQRELAQQAATIHPIRRIGLVDLAKANPDVPVLVDAHCSCGMHTRRQLERKAASRANFTCSQCRAPLTAQWVANYALIAMSIRQPSAAASQNMR